MSSILSSSIDMVLSRESFENFKDDLHVVGFFLYVTPKFNISLGAMETLVHDEEIDPDDVYDDVECSEILYVFKKPMHLDEFARLYDSEGRDLKVKDQNDPDVGITLRLGAVNPKCPDDGVSDMYLSSHQSDLVPIADGIPDLALYVKTYFERSYIDRNFCRPEQILHELFPENYATP